MAARSGIGAIDLVLANSILHLECTRASGVSLPLFQVIDMSDNTRHNDIVGDRVAAGTIMLRSLEMLESQSSASHGP